MIECELGHRGNSTKATFCARNLAFDHGSTWRARQAADVLGRLAAGGDGRLNDAVCDAIDLICDHGDTAVARREQLRTAKGTPVWKVSVRGANSGWVVLWWPVDDDAQIYYIGAL